MHSVVTRVVVVFLSVALFVTAVVTGAASAARAPSASELHQVAKTLLDKTGAGSYEIIDSGGYILIAVRFNRSRNKDAILPDTALYLYDKSMNKGSADAGTAIRIYADYLLKHYPTRYTVPVSSDLDQIDTMVTQTIEDLRPRVESANLLKALGETGELAICVGSLGSSATVKAALYAAIKYGMRGIELASVQEGTKLTYQEIQDAIFSEYDEHAELATECDTVLLRSRGLVGGIRKTVTVAEMVDAARTGGQQIEALRALEHTAAYYDLTGATATIDKMVSDQQVLMIGKVGFGAVKLIVSEAKFRQLAELLEYAYLGARIAEVLAAKAHTQLQEFKTSPSLDSLGMAITGALACRHLELTLRLEEAVLRANAEGSLGGFLEWLHGVLYGTGLAQLHMENLAAGAESIRDMGRQLRELRLAYLLRVRDSVDYVEALPLELEPPNPEPPTEEGLLDIVLCIDQSGSMIDDIKAVQDTATATLSALKGFAGASNISLHVGLVVYTRHDEPGWIIDTPLTSDLDRVKSAIKAINITDPAIGKGGNEDMYAALMSAMGHTVGGKTLTMGWRKGAAKIVLAVGDEPPDDPDFEKHALNDVAELAKALDPVHIYPLLTPKQGSALLDPAVRAMERIAGATGGQVIRVNSAEELPAAIVSAVKLAVRQHRDEVWRKKNPPYVMYGAIAAVLGVIVLAMVGMIIRTAARKASSESRRRRRRGA